MPVAPLLGDVASEFGKACFGQRDGDFNIRMDFNKIRHANQFLKGYGG